MSRLDSLLTLQLLMVITAGTAAYGQPKQTFTTIDFPGAAGTAHLPHLASRGARSGAKALTAPQCVQTMWLLSLMAEL